MFRKGVICMKILLFVILFFNVFAASANFMVYPISKDIQSGGSETIKVFSKSKDVQYIKIYTKRVINPGTKEEQEVDIKNWDGGLIVTPAKVVLPAGASKSIRLTEINKKEQEEVYRVYFESVKPGQQDDIEEKNGRVNTDLSVNIIYAALIRTSPENPQRKLDVSIESNNVWIKNTGNIRLGIKDVFLCDTTSINDKCAKFSYNRNLYPDMSVDTKLGKKGFSYAVIDTKDDRNENSGELINIKLP